MGGCEEIEETENKLIFNFRFFNYSRQFQSFTHSFSLSLLHIHQHFHLSQQQINFIAHDLLIYERYRPAIHKAANTKNIHKHLIAFRQCISLPLYLSHYFSLSFLLTQLIVIFFEGSEKLRAFHLFSTETGLQKILQ